MGIMEESRMGLLLKLVATFVGGRKLWLALFFMVHRGWLYRDEAPIG